MKIDLNHKCNIEDVEVGETFYYNNWLCMRIYSGISVTTNCNDDDFLILNLETNTLSVIYSDRDNNEVVTLVKTKIVNE